MLQMPLMDSSPRTKAISRPTWVTILCVVMIFVCLLWSMAGCRHYSNIQMNSSTPIGSELKFSQSGAVLTLAGLYVDQNDDVLIARLSPNDKANETLPYRGTDFTVFVQSEATKGYEEVPVLFGKMGTDGDYMLILPKPTEEVYSFVLVDSSSQAKRLDKPSRRGGSSVDEKGSVTRALAQFDRELKEDQSRDIGSSSAANSTGFDMAGLRMTINPAADGSEYRPETVNADLLNDRTRQFDFETFWQQVFVDTAVKKLTRDYNSLEARAQQAQQDADDQEQRLLSNPADEAAAKNLREAEKTVEEANRDKQNKADELTYYQTLAFDPSVFQNFQDKAVVVAD